MTQVSSDALTTGLGVDIVEIERMEKIMMRSPAFFQKVFSEGERTYCEAHARPAVHYATHFAAKEAVLKALGTGFSNGIWVRDVEVLHNDAGKPYVMLHGKAQEVADLQGVIEIPLSLSRTNQTAIANAIAVTAKTRPVREEKATAAQELASRFKELRSMLDELEQENTEDLHTEVKNEEYQQHE